MTLTDRERWDERYRAGAYADRTHPTRLLEEHAPRFPVGRALDLACGAGRNALYLAAMGFEVDAVDISSVALARLAASARERGLTVRTFPSDLTRGLTGTLPLNAGYDLIVLVRYVNVPLIAELCSHLAPGGIFVCEEHLVSDSDVGGPSRAAHRVQRGELFQAIPAMDVHFYREGTVRDPDGRYMALAQIIASRGANVELNYS